MYIEFKNGKSIIDKHWKAQILVCLISNVINSNIFLIYWSNVWYCYNDCFLKCNLFENILK